MHTTAPQAKRQRLMLLTEGDSITMTTMPTNSCTRSRRQRAARAILAALAISALTCTLLWVEETSSGRRRLAYLDHLHGTSPTADENRAQFQALVRPSDIDSSLHRHMPIYNEHDEDDSLCDDVLVYMPDSHADKGHGAQLNSYILAALLATYSNKAMVILDAPHERHPYKGSSQFGCPDDARTHKGGGWDKDFPRGLSRLVKHPRWLSCKCPMPCGDTYTYHDWESIRLARTKGPYYPKLYTPAQVQCANPNGRQSQVLVVGPDQVREYFDGHFRERMVQRPSNQAYRWATRLGASSSEAATFHTLESEDEIWNYISALVARSGLLRFQPWIARDVEEYIRNSGLPLDAPYDAVHVRRGDKLVEEAKPHVEEYWSNRHPLSPEEQVMSWEYIPFSHYLTQLDAKCAQGLGTLIRGAEDEVVHTVYVATDDPDEVKREVEKLPKDEDGRLLAEEGCSPIQLVFTPHIHIPSEGTTGTGFHLHDGPARGGCLGRYQRNIASVGDMMIAAKSETFVGEFNSNWGRLVRIFRMQLNNSMGGADGVATERKIKVAWGDDKILPPGL